MPSQCSNYTTIADATRLTTSSGGSACDNSSVFTNITLQAVTYVRFVSPGGTQLATLAPTSQSGYGFKCNTAAAGWTNATYPAVVGQTVNAFICFAYGTSKCAEYVYYLPITNCNGYYVHGLVSPFACTVPYRYCTQ